ncbi:hypothetical protein [Clostridium gelidum]|nr:hypothetical protein [Clostridium gelidum]
MMMDYLKTIWGVIEIFNKNHEDALYYVQAMKWIFEIKDALP